MSNEKNIIFRKYLSWRFRAFCVKDKKLFFPFRFFRATMTCNFLGNSCHLRFTDCVFEDELSPAFYRLRFLWSVVNGGFWRSVVTCVLWIAFLGKFFVCDDTCVLGKRFRMDSVYGIDCRLRFINCDCRSPSNKRSMCRCKQQKQLDEDRRCT